MDEGYEWLKHVADRMNDDVARGAAAEPERLTARELLQRFGYQKRSKWIKGYIGRILRRLGLRTDPDFRRVRLFFVGVPERFRAFCDGMVRVT